MHKKCIGLDSICFLILCSLSFISVAKDAWVCGFAQPQGSYTNLPDIDVFALESEMSSPVTTTDSNGCFAFKYPVGKELTLLFKYNGWWLWDYAPSQSHTITVEDTPELGDIQPVFNPENIVGVRSKESKYKNFITYQAIAQYKFRAIKLARLVNWYRAEPAPPYIRRDTCQLIVTAAASKKTLYHSVQGEAGTEIIIERESDNQKLSEGKDGLHFCYYGHGFMHSNTNPFCQPEKKMTTDGGVFIVNLPVDSGKYLIKAEHEKSVFNSTCVQCKQEWWERHAPGYGILINLSPPALQVID